MNLYVFSDMITGDKYLFICRADLDKFIKMYGCAYYNEGRPILLSFFK